MTFYQMTLTICLHDDLAFNQQHTPIYCIMIRHFTNKLLYICIMTRHFTNRLLKYVCMTIWHLTIKLLYICIMIHFTKKTLTNFQN